MKIGKLFPKIKKYSQKLEIELNSNKLCQNLYKNKSYECNGEESVLSYVKQENRRWSTRNRRVKQLWGEKMDNTFVLQLMAKR